MKKYLLLSLLALLLIACDDDDEVRKTVKGMRITKIIVTKFPQTTSNGGGWDFTSGPDIYPLFSKDGAMIYDSPDYFENASGSGQTFALATGIEISSPKEEYTLSLYDYDDLDPNDFMGEVIFKPYKEDQKFPSELTLDTGGTVAFKLMVTYSFDN